MSQTPDSDDDECPARYYFPDGSSAGCERFVHVGTDQPKPDEHLCGVTLRWAGERGGDDLSPEGLEELKARFLAAIERGGPPVVPPPPDELLAALAKLAKLETLAREIHKNASRSDYGDGRWEMARRILDVLDGD